MPRFTAVASLGFFFLTLFRLFNCFRELLYNCGNNNLIEKGKLLVGSSLDLNAMFLLYAYLLAL